MFYFTCNDLKYMKVSLFEISYRKNFFMTFKFIEMHLYFPESQQFTKMFFYWSYESILICWDSELVGFFVNVSPKSSQFKRNRKYHTKAGFQMYFEGKKIHFQAYCSLHKG